MGVEALFLKIAGFLRGRLFCLGAAKGGPIGGGLTLLPIQRDALAGLPQADDIAHGA